MLNARNVIAITAAVAVVCTLWAILSLFQSPAGSGLGVDTYGTREYGFGGLFETLEALHVAVERSTAPPNQYLNRQITLAFLDPNVPLTATEPAFLNAVGQWIEGGGSVVVAPSIHKLECAPCLGLKGPPKGVLAELGLHGVEPRWLGPEPKEYGLRDSMEKSVSDDVVETAEAQLQWLRTQPQEPPRNVDATADGILTSTFPSGLKLVLPPRTPRVLDPDGEPAPEQQKTEKNLPSRDHQSSSSSSRNTAHDPLPKAADGSAKVRKVEGPNIAGPKRGGPKVEGITSGHSEEDKLPVPVPAGRIRAVVEPDGEPQTLAAIYKVGRGTIAVVADPAVLQNGLVAQGDNAVLASHLLADFGKPVVFDEFYHGLTVRGNPLWLLSRFPYGLLAATALAATAVAVWRAARFLGPALPQRETSRRTLSEYIEAMARLLNRSRDPGGYILNEIRGGLVWRIRHELDLPPGPDDAAAVVQALAKRDPQAAQKAADAFSAIDAALRQPKPSAQTLDSTFKKVTLCVPRRTV